MTIKILFFGLISEIIGSNTIELKDMENLRILKSYLWKTYPSLKDMDFRFAVNNELVQERANFKDGDEVALLPPFAGG